MRLNTLPALCLLIGFVLTTSCRDFGSPIPDSNASRLLPEAPPGWDQFGSTRIIWGSALSDYIDGGAEAYLAYGFREAAVREFTNDAGARLTVEIYEMSQPENAYGIFSTDSSGERLPVGADASYGSGLLRFWKGRFFVRIVCYPADETIEKIITDTGHKIADAIEGESRRPTLFLSLVPEAGVEPDSICYFHRQTSLNNIRFLGDENLLHLNDSIDAITWEERVSAEPDGTLRQIVLRYPTEAEAEAAHVDFSRKYLGFEPAASSSVAPRLPNGKYVTAGCKARWVVIVLDAPTYESASTAFRQTLTRLSMMKETEGSS